MDRVFSFLLWPKREARGPWKQGRKKRGSITCRTDRANEANKMFIIWLCRLFRFWKGDRELAVRPATYGPGIDQSRHAKSVSHMINYCNFQTVHVYVLYSLNNVRDKNISVCHWKVANQTSSSTRMITYQRQTSRFPQVCLANLQACEVWLEKQGLKLRPSDNVCNYGTITPEELKEARGGYSNLF